MTDTPPVTEVSIDTPPLTVTCKHPGGNLEEVVRITLDLYREAYTPDMTRPGSPVGFVTELE